MTLGGQPYLMEGGIFLGGFLLSFIISQTGLSKEVRRRVEVQLRERKDQFIALGSHYMLTPLSIIQTATATLQEKDPNISLEERQRLYDTILRGQQRLFILAEQLLVVGEIDQGDLRLNVSISNLSNTVTSAISAVDSFARAKKITIRVADQTSVSEGRYDAKRIKQALIAVLDNAIKFTPEEGEVIVTIQAERAVFTIVVQDNGIGMQQEIIDHLSEKFYRGTSLYNFDYEGLGLGLHIAQYIIQLHQGSIVFASAPKRGTIITIQFPNL